MSCRETRRPAGSYTMLLSTIESVRRKGKHDTLNGLPVIHFQAPLTRFNGLE